MATYSPHLELPGYEVRRCIGAGGMGEVFEAFDRSLGRPVAIKRLRSDRMNLQSPAFGTWNARFKREARLLAAVNHPNIATVHAVVEHVGQLHMVMEYVEGRSLRDALRAGPLSLQDSIEVCRQIAAGLMAAHDAGVIHRDIKPDNILIGRKGVVKILDFGLARQFGKVVALELAATKLASQATTVFGTAQGVVLGTPGYAAPEQVLGRETDQRADVFGFGCVLFECLCGRKAFDGQGKYGADVVLVEDAAWVLLPEATPEWARDLARACLSRLVTDRPGGFAEVIAAIRKHSGDGEGCSRVEAVREPAKRLPNNLPIALGGFVGRAAECERIAALVRGARLVTVIGLGGSGKTRLALHIAGSIAAAPHPWLGVVEDGVFVVRLAGLSTRRQVAHAIARAIAPAGALGRGAGEADRLIEQIGAGRMLVVLDQCEHVADEAAELLNKLLHTCPGLRVLATSRERLGVAGEQVYSGGPLACRAGVGGGGASRFMGGVSPAGPSEAAELFMLRARQAAPDFAAGPTELDCIERLCARIGGWPLAIEVAAGFSDTISPGEIETRLARDLGLVLDAPAISRSDGRTLASVVDWTCSKLTSQERTLLIRLSVFSGDFTLEGAERVCSDAEGGGDRAGGPAVRSAAVLGLLTSLVRKSLLSRRDSTTVPAPHQDLRTRYSMLDPIRESARRMATPAEEPGIEATRARLCAYALDVVLAAAPKLEGPEQSRWIGVVEGDYADVRTAFAWSLASGRESRRAMDAAAALAPFWYKTWMVAEGRSTLESAIRAGGVQLEPPACDPLLARAAKAAGILCWMCGDRPAARAWYSMAITIAGQLADRHQEASLSSNLGLLLAEDGDVEGACRSHQRALSIYMELGDAVRTAQAELNLAAAENRTGRDAEARARLIRCLSSFRAVGDDVRASVATSDLGEIELRAGNLRPAWGYFREGLVYARRTGSIPGQFTATAMLGFCAAKAGHAQLAVALLGYVDRLKDGSRLTVQSDLMVDAITTYGRLLREDPTGDLAKISSKLGTPLEVDAMISQSVVFSDGPVSQG